MTTTLTKKQAIACYMLSNLGLLDCTLEQGAFEGEARVLKRYLPGLVNKGIAEALPSEVYGRGVYRVDSGRLYEAFDEWKNKNISEYERITEAGYSDNLLLIA